MRPTLRSLVTEGLGYCCPWAFFSIFRNTAVIAARLGVHEVSVRRLKAQVDGKVLKCEQCERCMKEHVRTVAIVGKRDLGLAEARKASNSQHPEEDVDEDDHEDDHHQGADDWWERELADPSPGEGEDHHDDEELDERTHS